MSQGVLFEDPAERRERIVRAVAERFPCYGQDTAPNHRNPLAVSLAHQPATFAFGVRVADVVATVLELAEQP